MVLRSNQRFLVFLALLSSCPVSGQDPCSLMTALPSGMMMSPVGGQVDIDCGLGDQEGREWTFNGRDLSPLNRYVINGTRLTLRNVSPKDKGSYACFRNATKVKDVWLFVGDFPRPPKPTCQLKSYLSPIRCEWHSKELKRLTKCTLSFRTSFQQKNKQRPCRFYTGRQVCVCTAPHTEGEYEYYFIALTVSNGIGCVTGKQRMFTFDSLLKSDPPDSVRARPVRQAPHKLNVTWAYPRTWPQSFYTLKFEISYSVQELFRSVDVRDTNYLIADALPSKNYTVRVRARDEFNHGSWSDWSPDVFVVPWADPRRNMVPEEETEGYPSTDIECEACSLEEKTPQGSHHPKRNIFPEYMLWLVVTCLVSMSVLVIVILIRYRKKWKPKGKGKAQAQAQPEILAVGLIERPQEQQDPKDYEASVETPLQGGSGNLPSTEKRDVDAQEEDSQFDVVNPGYFYIQN